jgi:ABC-type lipoprotein export system ATPase subunit
MKPEPQVRGATWRVWDLHVHTPSSLVQNYGGDTPTAWERYLNELEALPPQISVIGINDYWFLDGYRKVLAAKASGRLKNLDMIFPVVEMRLDQFGGTDGHLTRVNLHVIFDPELDPDLIEQQFFGSINSQFSLKPGTSTASWKGVVTRDSLADLGAQIKAGVPKEQLPKYKSDLIEGFNNLNVSMETVRGALNNTFLEGKAIVGLGKTEWAQIKWNDGSVANKKSLITEAKFLFTAFEDTSVWPAQVEAMKAAGVNHKILDCSDAHTWASDTANKDRLGACSTWLNTTPSFAGLLHALEEFDQRVFVGLEPPALGLRNTSPEQYIESVSIRSTDPSRAKAFNYDLPLNSGFVAIVGNKGQGKSALLDCIALAGNSSRTSEFAFLTGTRFLNASNKTGRMYEAELDWLNGSSRKAVFGSPHVGAAPVQVEYLPQRYVERVCTIDPLSDESHEFEDELREVLFTHIPDDERAGEITFDALLAAKTESAKATTNSLRNRLKLEADRYVALNDFLRENPAKDVRGKLKLKGEEIVAAERDLAEATARLAESDAVGEDDDETITLRAESVTARETLERERATRAGALQNLGLLQQRLATVADLERRAQTIADLTSEINAELGEVLEASGELPVAFVDVAIHGEVISGWRSRVESTSTGLRSVVEAQDLAILSLVAEIERLDALLAAADGARELARQRLLQIEERLKLLRGSVDTEGSEAWLSELLARSIASPAAIANSQASLISISKEVHEALEGELRAVTDLYGPASRFIEKSEVVKKAGLEFKAELSVVSRLQAIRDQVDGRKSPDLLGWLSDLPERVDGAEWAELAVELNVVFARLTHERGSESGIDRHPSDALRSSASASDFIVALLDLTWIEVRFGLTGDGLPLAQLSPGQRGLVLALFYLIVDLRTTPLLLDQPEENLDNATIASLLVPAIQEAAGRRQTIIVTHNANLAIVGNADQIVHCTVANGVFGVTSGCISEFPVAKSAVDVLEGTKPAFDIRRHKYEAFPQLV